MNRLSNTFFILLFNIYFGQTNPLKVLPENIGCAPKTICGVDNSLFKKILNKNTDKYKLIYTWTYFCKPCREILPKVNKFANENKDRLQLYYITDIQKADQVRSTMKIIEMDELERPVYNIVQKSVNKKILSYENFMQNIDSTLKLREYGYSLFILLDSNNNVIYHTNLADNDDTKLEHIKNFLK